MRNEHLRQRPVATARAERVNGNSGHNKAEIVDGIADPAAEPERERQIGRIGDRFGEDPGYRRAHRHQPDPRRPTLIVAPVEELIRSHPPWRHPPGDRTVSDKDCPWRD